MRRRPIPVQVKHRLLYESKYVCCVCQQGGCQIHHIDEDRNNNSETNLVVLCAAHHDEAHTTRKLTKNLGPSELRHAKEHWTSEVRNQRSLGATVAGQRAQASDEWLRIGITWGYINHKRVVQLAKPELLTGKDLELFARCKKVGIVDERGIVICPPGPRSASSYIDNSIYDRFEFGDDQRLHALYTSFVDQISSSVDG